MHSSKHESPLRPLRSGLFAALLTLLLGACSGGSGDFDGVAGASGGPAAESCDFTGPAASDQCGTVLVSLTDADGDFIAYSVDVLSLRLRRANGDTVETFPDTTRIDFASLVDVSELISAAAVPPGLYVGGTIRLDYATAEIYVEAGGDVVAAEIVNADGAALGTVEIDFELAPTERLVVTRARLASLTVDFDLAASHTVDTGTSPPLVTARPYVVAEVRPVEEKELRVRGALLDVDTAGSTYTVQVRPWHRWVGDHGRVEVLTTDETRFDVDNENYVGRDGLDALAQLPQGTLTAAFGRLDLDTLEFTAELVLAGHSVGGHSAAVIYGHVTARSGDRLIVSAAWAVHPSQRERFHRRVAVELGPDTRVYKEARPLELLDKDAISVGQRIVASGALMLPSAGSAPDTVPVLDATQGRARMRPTRLRGTVTGVLPGQLNIRVRAIDRLGVDLFDFSGTGVTPMQDADPNDYEIATGTRAAAAVAVDEPVHAIGFVAPFGAAPPDFQAGSLIDHRSLAAALGIGWGAAGTSAPFLSIGPDGLVPNLADPRIGSRHHLLIGARRIDLLELPAAPTIAPRAGRALFGISAPGRVELFRDFASFTDALARRLGQGDKVQSLAAYGSYDLAANALSAWKISVHVVAVE